MTNTTFHIDRSELQRVFDPRAARQFEDLQRQVSENTEATSAGLAATDAQGQATYITLSPNAELPNERVLSLGDGLRFDVTDDSVTLYSDAPRLPNGHSVSFATTGDTNLALPIAGIVATREWFASLGFSALPGPFANDAAAATGGVAVGGIYKRGSTLAARLT